MMTLAFDFAGFDRYLSGLGLAPATRKSYMSAALRMDTDPVAWLRKQIARRRPLGTLLPMRAAVKHVLLSGCAGEPIMDPDAVDRLLPHARGRKAELRDALSPDALAAYLAAAEGEAEPVRTILLLLPRSGLRIAEACALRLTDVKWIASGCHLSVRHGKGDKGRVVPLGPEGVALLREWLAGRDGGQEVGGSSPWLFPGYVGRAITPAAVRLVTRRLAEQHPELESLSPHVLRHTYATRAVAGGLDLRRVQALLGHESMATTARYLHPTTHDLEQGIGKVEGL